MWHTKMIYDKGARRDKSFGSALSAEIGFIRRDRCCHTGFTHPIKVLIEIMERCDRDRINLRLTRYAFYVVK